MSEHIGLKDNVIIIGKMQSGKTTAADYLAHNYGFNKVAIAEPLKQLVLQLDSMDCDQLIKEFISPFYKLPWQKRDKFLRILEATKGIPSEFPKPRKRLQFLGTDGVRKQIDNDFWLKLLWQKIKDCEKVVIDDCRFLNEYEFLKGKGFADIKVLVSDEVQHERLCILNNGPYDIGILTHPSELDQPKIFEMYPENIITNNGTIEEYYSKISNMVAVDVDG